MDHWIDAHNHLQDRRLRDPGLVMATLSAAGVVGSVVNATSEDDWSAVAELAKLSGGRVIPAYGLHPWKAHTAGDGWIERLRGLLVGDAKASIGEIGLDRWVAEPAIDVQLGVFRAQLELARELDRPVTIHCLKAWGPLLDTFDKCPPPSRFLLHSFNGSIEIARRLVPLGAYFSFSGHFLHARKAELVEVFRHLPKERILLETDAPDMLPPGDVVEHPLDDGVNHPANLPAIGRALAQRFGMPATELAAMTAENAARCFGVAFE